MFSILMITAEMESDNIRTATAAGADGYIAKSSLDADILRKTLDGIMRKRRPPYTNKEDHASA